MLAYVPTRGPRAINYGTNEGADLRALEVRSLPGLGVQAELVWWNAPQGQLEIAAPGVHNVRNALAALVVGVSCGVALMPRWPPCAIIAGRRGASSGKEK
ncbi:MAG: hypothetical protein IPM07_30295 [Anaerolineales bacterium]|nr:hypothetical protein [Anaerolineales bacterium]